MTRSERQQFFKTARRIWTGSLFDVRALPAAIPATLLVVPRAIGAAVVRNRIKRRLRVALRTVGPLAFTLGIFAKAPAAQASLEDILYELRQVYEILNRR